MLYLVYVLTFLAGILFYVLSPRDDQVNLDAYRAEGFIASFLAQHQAAKDCMTQWLGFNLSSSSENYIKLDKDNFGQFLPTGILKAGADISSHQKSEITMDKTEENAGDNDFRYLTNVFCLQDANTPIACNSPNFHQAYLVTYSMGRPAWWPAVESNRQRRYGAWRNAITRRTSGSYNCGVLTNEGTPSGDWCVDNGQTVLTKTGQCAQKVPKAICDTLGCVKDAFFCISRVKQGPEKYYVPGLSAFYDGINNNNTGAEGTRNESSTWNDLINPSGSATNADFSNTDFMASKSATSNPIQFPIYLVPSSTQTSLFRPFTLTVLLQSEGQADPNSRADTDTITFLTLGDPDSSTQASFQLQKENGSCSIAVTGSALSASKEFNLDDCKAIEKLSALTVIGGTDKLQICIDTHCKEEWKLESSDFSNFYAIRTPAFKIVDNSFDVYVYGVRYYADKALTTTPDIKDKRIPSELEQNLKMDSKRYGFSYQ